MRTAPAALSPERWAVAIVVAALLAPLLATFTAALHVPLLVGAMLALLAGAVATAPLARRLPREWDGALRARPLLCALWGLVALAAVVRSAGVAWFMADPAHAQTSAFWFDAFYIRHNCYSALWQAAELARDGVANLYDPEHYTGVVGRFKLDEFLYPPQTLILPGAGLALGADFQALRAAWFAICGGVLAVSMLVLCRWIGGATGRRAALLLPAVWVSTPLLLTLQLGNYQIIAVVMSMMAMLLFERDRPIAGGALLGFAVFKLFPGLLGVYLLFARRWRAAAWTAAFSLLYTAVAYAMFGRQPFDAFVHFQIPRILSGDAWAFLRLEGLEAVVAINDSVPGVVNKLHVLGVPGMSGSLERVLAWAWTLVAVALAALAARRASAMSRPELAATWLALLTLAAYRSPFVPDHNGLFAPMWMWSLIAATSLANRRNILLLAVAWLGFAAVLPFSGAPLSEGTARLVVSTFSQLIATGLCGWVLLRRPQTQVVGLSNTATPAPITFAPPRVAA